MDLCSVGNKYCVVRFGNWGVVAMILLQEGERYVVSGTDYNMMDTGEFSAIFKNYSPGNWFQNITQLRILWWLTFESANLSRDTCGPRREKSCREIEDPAPGNLVYFLCFCTYLTSNIGRRDARAD